MKTQSEKFAEIAISGNVSWEATGLDLWNAGARSVASAIDALIAAEADESEASEALQAVPEWSDAGRALETGRGALRWRQMRARAAGESPKFWGFSTWEEAGL